MKLILKELIAKILSMLKDPVRVIMYQIPSITIAANSTYTTTTLSVAHMVPSGYRAIAILPRASGSYMWYFYQTGYGNGNVVLQIRSIAGSSITARPVIDIVCIKA